MTKKASQRNMGRTLHYSLFSRRPMVGGRSSQDFGRQPVAGGQMGSEKEQHLLAEEFPDAVEHRVAQTMIAAPNLSSHLCPAGQQLRRHAILAIACLIESDVGEIVRLVLGRCFLRIRRRFASDLVLREFAAE